MFLQAPRSAARLAWLRDDLACAMAAWTRLLNREKPLLHADLPVTAARRAGRRLRARFGAAALARFAFFHGRDADTGLGAGRSVFQSDFEVVAQVGAAEDTGPGAATAENVN